MTTALYGAGLAWPLAPDSTGRLATTSGVARIDESLTQILETPQGSRPLDPRYGVPPMAYEPITQPAALAYQVGLAIEYAEPRIESLDIRVESVDRASGLVRLRMEWRAIGSPTTRNRIFPFWQRAA